MRFLTPVALALVMLWVPVDGVAQNLGDKIRVKIYRDDSWTEGLLSELTLGTAYVEAGVTKDNSTFVMMDETGSSRRVLRIDEIFQGDYYKRRPSSYAISTGMASGILFELINPCARGYPDHSCLTESAALNRSEQFLWGILVGGLAGLLIHQFSPGKWEDWIEGGRITVN